MNKIEDNSVRNRKGYKEVSTENESDLTEKPVTASNTRIIAFVFLSLLLDLLAFTMILPLFPSLLDYYNKEEGSGDGLYATLFNAVKSFQKWTGTPDRFVSVLFGGALGSMYSFLQYLTSPIAGSLSDAFGRKPILLLSLTGIAISHALWGYASTFIVFVVARIVGGLSKANISLCMAVVTDASHENTRAKGMALIGLAFSIGFIVGPMAGAWFSKNVGVTDGPWGERPANYALALSLANIVLVVFCIPETLPKAQRLPLSFTISKLIDFVSPWRLLKFTAVRNLSSKQSAVLSRMGLIYFLYLFIYSGLEFTVTFLTHHTFKYTAMQQGKMFLVIGVIMAMLQGGAARRLSAKGAEKAAKGALILTPVSFVAVALATVQQSPVFAPITWLWTGLVLFAISTAFAVTCMTSMAADVAPSEARGLVLGCLRSLGALARAAGPLVASSMYWCSGAFVTYIIGSFILIIPAVMLCRLKS